MVLGEPVLQRRVYSVYSASRQFGVHPKTLRKFLVGSGLIEDDGKIADAHATFEANAGERLIAQLKRGISEKPLQSYLNVPRPALRPLIADGLLKPMTVGEGEGMNDLFDTDEVDRFLTELAANAIECLQLPTGSWDISSAAGRANCSIVEVVRLIQAGGLKQVARLTHVQGFMSIAVDLEEVRAAVRLPAVPGLVPTDISDYFGMTDAASKALVDHGILESVVGKNPINRGPQRYVPWPAIEAFNTRYISLRDLGKLRGVNSRRLLRELGETGIHPEPNLLGLGAYIFERTSVT